MRWRLSAASLALLVAVSLGGCATIPVSGPVETAPAQVEQNDPGFVYVPNDPAIGASPENIVRGFIQAASGGGRYTVAKKFLTAGFAATWDPDAEVRVHTASWTTTKTADDRIELRVPTSAVLVDGILTPSTTPKPYDFRLQQVRGQWRIADGPDGVVLSQSAFLRVFKPVLLQFFDDGFTRFVPDRRWFPTRSSNAADTVRALLAGQALPLDGVTRSAFPAGTRLLRLEQSSDGRTSIEVRTPVGQPDEKTTDRMQQQLAESLSPMPVSSIRLTVNGRTAPTAQLADLQQLSPTSPVVVAGGRFGSLTTSGTVLVEGDLGPKIVAQKPVAVTFSAKRRLAAVLSGGGDVVIVDRSRSKVVDTRGGLVAPTMDQLGWTYSVPRDDPSGLRVFDSSGRQRAVAISLGGAVVTAIEVSPDGTRLLVLSADSNGSPKAYVAGIERDAEGAPLGLTTDQYVIALGSDAVLDATWADQSQVAVLTAGSQQTVLLQQLGGISKTLGALQGASRIVGSTSQDDLRVLLGTGALAQPSSNAWTQEFPASTGVAVLAVQR